MYSGHPTGRPPTPLPGSKILSKKKFYQKFTLDLGGPVARPPPTARQRGILLPAATFLRERSHVKGPANRETSARSTCDPTHLLSSLKKHRSWDLATSRIRPVHPKHAIG